MIHRALSTLVLAVLPLLTVEPLVAAPVDLSAPSTTLGASNARGYLEIWREYGEVDFGQDLKLPLRAQFSSERQSESVCLGKGWWLPLTEATAYLKREKMLQATLICGKTMYLRKDGAQANTFYSLDKEWKGVIDGKEINISREDGWNLRYENGRIKSLKTDTGRQLTWVYSGNMAVEIKEEGSPSTPFKLDLTSTGSPKGIYANNKLHSFTLEKRPKVQSVAAKNLVTGFDAALSSWKLAEGSQETYQFEVTEEVQPNLKLTDKETGQTTYVWDAGSGHILSDGQWTYLVGKVTSEFELPELRRVNTAGKEEFVKIDNKLGIFERESITRGHLVTETYKTPGPLYGKVKKVVRLEEGKEVPVLQYSYDEKGKLLRKIDDKGFTTVFNYDDKGKLKDTKLLPLKNPEILQSLKEKEAALLKAIEAADNEQKKGDQMQLLGFFYIHEMRDYEKALKMIPLMQNPKQRYNIQLASIHSNLNLTKEEKNARYKELLKEYPKKKPN
ncbi:MAG: hypothetical protein HC904_10550 [Blastochloris sp.]|nr:hypothetical protein [Blastochloris sp.]